MGYAAQAGARRNTSCSWGWRVSTKLTALILLPVFLFFCVRDEGRGSRAWRRWRPFCFRSRFFVVPWLIVFYRRMASSFLVGQARRRLMELYHSFVAPLSGLVSTTWSSWFSSCRWHSSRRGHLRVKERWTNRTIQIAVSWFLVVLVTLTYLGVDGYGFQMRHIAPAVAACMSSWW